MTRLGPDEHRLGASPLAVDAASADEHHPVGGVVRLDVLGEVIPLDGQDVLLGSENGTAERLLLECDGVEVVKDNLLGLLVHLLLFTDDDVALPLDRTGLELRVLQNIADDVDGLADVLLERLGIVHRLLSFSCAPMFSTSSSRAC
jgi:hypothetical protein